MLSPIFTIIPYSPKKKDTDELWEKAFYMTGQPGRDFQGWAHMSPGFCPQSLALYWICTPFAPHPHPLPNNPARVTPDC